MLLWDVFSTWSCTRFLKSILSCSPMDVAALVVDNGSGMCSLVCKLRYSSCCVPCLHSRCFICGICPDPLVSDSQLFAVRALLEKSFLSPRWLTPVICRGLGGDGDAGSSLPGVLTQELSACVGVYGETHTSQPQPQPQPQQHHYHNNHVCW